MIKTKVAFLEGRLLLSSQS